jgi:flagellar biosynthesis/type III secretory pathway protein FliH
MLRFNPKERRSQSSVVPPKKRPLAQETRTRKEPPQTTAPVKKEVSAEKTPEKKARLKENKEAVLKSARKTMGISEEKRADFQQRMQAARERKAKRAGR